MAVASCGGDDDDDDLVESEDGGADDVDAPADDEDDQGDEDDPAEGDDDSAADETEAEADDDDDESDESSDACSLLTVEEAEGILGETVSGAEPSQPSPLFAVCSWPAESTESFAIIVLQVLDEFPGGAEAFHDTTLEGLEQSGEEGEEISGLGDEAVYYAGLLQVREGDELFAISVTLADGDDASNRAATEEAAQLVLDNLD
jgi:hypothetical protein